MNNRGFITSLILIFITALILVALSFDFGQYKATQKIEQKIAPITDPVVSLITPYWNAYLDEPWDTTIRPFLVTKIGNPLLDIFEYLFVAGKSELKETLDAESSSTSTAPQAL